VNGAPILLGLVIQEHRSSRSVSLSHPVSEFRILHEARLVLPENPAAVARD